MYRLQNGEIQLSKQSGAASTFQSVTAPNVVVEYMWFYVDGATSDTEQAGVLITLGGYVEDSNRTRTEFNLETFVSQRLFEG